MQSRLEGFTSHAVCCWALRFEQHGHLQRITCINTHVHTQRMTTDVHRWTKPKTQAHTRWHDNMWLNKLNMEHETKLYTDKVLEVFLRVVEPLERLLDSSRCRDLGLLLRDLVRGRGLTRPCSSINACCFLRRYSCLISSRRAFSSSLRMRSSSALRLQEMYGELRFLDLHT